MSTRVWPGQPFPLGATWDGDGTNFSLFSENAERVELCLFDAQDRETRVELRERTAFNWHGYLPGRRARAALRLPRARAVRPREGPPLQPAQAADRPLREGDRGPDPVGRRQRAPLRARRPGRRPRARRHRRRRRDPEVRRRRPGLRLGGRPPPGHALERDPHLRGPREGLHQAAPRRARGPARHLRRPRLRPGHRAPALARRDRRGAAARAPHRRRAAPGLAGPHATTGATARSATSRPTRSTPPPGTPASRCASSRAW